MATCSYTLTDKNGKRITLQGKSAFKAYLVEGGLEHLMPERAYPWAKQVENKTQEFELPKPIVDSTPLSKQDETIEAKNDVDLKEAADRAMSAEQFDAAVRKAYMEGDLEPQQYMVARQLLLNKDYESIQKILDQLETPTSKGQASSVKVKGNVDLKRLLSLVGSSMYKANLADTSIKEMVQNSFDAVKAQVLKDKSLKGKGQIDIVVDDRSRLIAIRDNGTGMDAKTIQGAFLTVAGSNKEGLEGGNASGGFGMAKAAFLYGNERIYLRTVKNGKLYTLDTTGDELLSKTGKAEIKVEDTNEPNGTLVMVKVPEQVEVDGEKRTVYFPYDYGNIDFFRQPLLNDDVSITYKMGNIYETDDFMGADSLDEWKRLTSNSEVVPIGKNFDMSGYDKNTTATFSWGTADIYLGKERIADSWKIKHKILSSGVYQFDDAFNLQGFEKIPYNIIVNVKPNVDASSASYPFNLKREGWKDVIENDVKALKGYVKQVALGISAQETADVFKNIKTLPKIAVENIGAESNIDISEFIPTKVSEVKEPKKVYTPKEINVGAGKVTGANDKGETVTYVDVEAEKAKEKPKDSTFTTDKAAPKVSDYLLDVGIDSSSPVYLNNTNVDYLSIDPNAAVMFAEIGNILMQAKAKVTSLGGYDYSKLKDGETFMGISIDRQYHGVHVNVPFHGIFLNPLAVKGKSLPSIVYGLWDTIVHEFTHVAVGNHNENFTIAYHELAAKLAADGFDLDMRVLLTRVLKKHKQTFLNLRDNFEQSTTKNIAKSIHEGEKGTGEASARATGADSGDTQDNTQNRSGTVQGRQSQTGQQGLSGNAQAGGAGQNGRRVSQGGGAGLSGGITNINRQANSVLRNFFDKKKTDTLIYNFQNRFVDLKNQIEKVIANGGTVNPITPTMREELYHQRTASRIKDFYDKEVNPILEKLHSAKIGFDEFQKFLHARHAPSRNRVMAERNPNQEIIDQKLADAQQTLKDLRTNPATPYSDIRAAVAEVNKWEQAKPFKGTEEERLSLSGLTDAEAAQILAAIPAPKAAQMRQLADKIDAINNKTLDLMVEYEMETPETIRTLKNQWEHYVPLHRDEAHPEENTFGHPIGRGYSIKGSGLKTATGSNAEVTNILAHITAAREQMFKRGEKNMVSKSIADFITANPDNEFAQINKVETEDRLVNGLVAPVAEPLFKRNMADNVVMYRYKGKDYAIVFNDSKEENIRLALSLKNMDGDTLDAVESLIGKGTRYLASVNTQYNVVFGIMNLMRDTQAMLLNLSNTPLAGRQKAVFNRLGDAIKAIGGVERDWANVNPRLKSMYERFNKAGGTTGYAQLFDTITKRNDSLESKLAQFGENRYKRFGREMIKSLNDFNTVMENSTRLAVFMEAVDRGMTDDQAASLAKNITVNFNRKGAQATKIGAFYAFFNASAQGTARMAQTLSGPKGRQIMMGGVAVGAALTMIAIATMGEDDWEKIPEFVRERSLILPLSGGKYIAVPMPLGFHVFPNIGRKFVEAAFGSKKVSPTRRFVQLAGSSFGAFNPLGGSDVSEFVMPTILDPALALWRNKDWTGRSIYKEDFNMLRPTPGFSRTKEGASWISKQAAEALNKVTGGTQYKQGLLSPTPDQIDFIIGQLTGGTGRELLKAQQAASAITSGEKLPTQKIPLVGRLYGEAKGDSVERSLYYENLKMINEHHAEVKGLMAEPNGAAKRNAYLRENPEALLYARAVAIQKDIGNLSDRRALLKKSGKLTADIDSKIAAKMKQLNDAIAEKIKR